MQSNYQLATLQPAEDNVPILRKIISVLQNPLREALVIKGKVA